MTDRQSAGDIARFGARRSGGFLRDRRAALGADASDGGIAACDYLISSQESGKMPLPPKAELNGFTISF
jgi:hypothetical protein